MRTEKEVRDKLENNEKKSDVLGINKYRKSQLQTEISVLVWVLKE